MKVVCQPTTSKFIPPVTDWITDKDCRNLTPNKIYDVIGHGTDDGDNRYLILDDSGRQELYNRYLFVPLDEIRNEKINSILD